MYKRTILCLLIVGVLPAVAAEVDQHVMVTADVEGFAIEQVFESGDIVPVTLYVTSEGGAAIFGVDLDVAVTTDDVRIHSVTAHPAFSRTLGRPQAELPGPRYHVVCVQPLRSIDRTLGADGEAIPFVTLELEMLEDAHFESALQVHAACALVGVVPKTTTVLGIESAGCTSQCGKIEIINARPALEPDAAEPESAPWIYESAALAIEVQPVDGDRPVSVLAPNTTYQLHYHADCRYVDGYVLSVIAASADQGLTDVTAPAVGEWALLGNPTFVDIEAESGELVPAQGYPQGCLRTHVIPNQARPGASHPGAQGHLCNFTTGSAGVLNLELYMDWFDRDRSRFVEMWAQAQLLVQEPATE
ncbi:MAG: hypothetical protein KAV82_11505 [Phycisphaerae bacterium]|nr:hypothetical protein [Phycisphaerae bacterium]